MYTNKINGKRYIGQAKDFNKRHTKHKYAVNSDKNERDYNVPIHRAMRKYGIDTKELVNVVGVNVKHIKVIFGDMQRMMMINGCRK